MAKKNRSEVEQELKISVSVDDLEKVFKAFARQVKKREIQHKFLPRDYYDTENLDMYAAGVSLRIQYKPGALGKLGSYEQTVKFELPPEGEVIQGALYRKECKDILSGNTPEVDDLHDTDADDAMDPFKTKRLSHIFTAAIERRYFNVEAGKGKNWGEVELAFDVGKISLPAYGLHQPFAEIEVEIKKGSPKAIAAIKDEIFKIAPSAKIQSDAKSGQGSKFYRKTEKKLGKPPRAP